MNKLKVSSIILLLSCVQMYAADRGDSTTTPVLMADYEVVTKETNNRLPKELIDDIEREGSQFIGKASDKRKAKRGNDIEFGSRYPCINSKEMNENAIGSMARRGSKRCCGSLWTGGVWLVTSIGSLAGFGSNTVEASKKKK